MHPEKLLNEENEVVVTLADGWALRSGVYDPDDPDARVSGEYVRLTDPKGVEFLYWDQDEWKADPALVMGAILNAAAGARFLKGKVACDQSDEGCEGCAAGYHYS
jgi:hypothetical protein